MHLPRSLIHLVVIGAAVEAAAAHVVELVPIAVKIHAPALARGVVDVVVHAHIVAPLLVVADVAVEMFTNKGVQFRVPKLTRFIEGFGAERHPIRR